MRAALVVALVLAGCTPNPRNEIAAIAEVALAHAVQETRDTNLCVDRQIVPWQPNTEVRRIDTPAPPGFELLRAAGVFRGGGGLKGDRVGGVAVRGRYGCVDLRGPVIVGDRALMEVHLAPTAWNLWLRKTDGDWRVVMTTTSYYPG